ncbi:MAG: hypothetical protein NT070_15150 [Cyanobacteria bacterium]|nr:hypothetical protein [Cyanobacteriota bacterium]
MQTVIWKLVEINKVEEALKLCPMIESNHAKHQSIGLIANKMAELGQIKQAIDLCNQYLHYAQKDFQDIENNIRNRITYLQPLDIFNDVSLEFPVAKDLAVKALELFPDEKSRREFALYLRKLERFEQAIAIVETLKENSNFLISMVANLSEGQKFEEAKQVLLMCESGKTQVDAFVWIVSKMESFKLFEKAIDFCEWYLTNISNIPDDAAFIVSSRLNYLNQKIAGDKI